MTCEQHPDRLECSDILIHYDPRDNEYALPVRDGIDCHSFSFIGSEIPMAKRRFTSYAHEEFSADQLARFAEQYDGVDMATLKGQCVLAATSLIAGDHGPHCAFWKGV